MIWRALTRQKTPAPGQLGWPVLYAAAHSGKRSVSIAPLPPPWNSAISRATRALTDPGLNELRLCRVDARAPMALDRV